MHVATTFPLHIWYWKKASYLKNPNSFNDIKAPGKKKSLLGTFSFFILLHQHNNLITMAILNNSRPQAAPRHALIRRDLFLHGAPGGMWRPTSSPSTWWLIMADARAVSGTSWPITLSLCLLVTIYHVPTNGRRPRLHQAGLLRNNSRWMKYFERPWCLCRVKIFV